MGLTVKAALSVLMKFRTFIVALAITGSMLFLGGIGGFLGITLQRPLNALQNEALAAPSAAIFVPKRSPLMLSLLVNPDRLLRLREIVASPAHRRQAIAEVAQLKRTLLDPIGVNYEQDVQAWLGNEITFAVTAIDRDRDPSNGEQPGYLWAIASQDGNRAREFMQLFWQKRAIAGASLLFEQYAGVQLIYQQPQAVNFAGSDAARKVPAAHQSMASAVVGNQFLLFANDPAVLRQAITTAQARDLNLVQSPIYQRTLQTLASHPIGLTYINLSAFNRWIGLTDDSLPASLIESETPPLDTLLLAFHLHPQGILADTVLTLTDGSNATLNTPADLSTAKALRHIPPSATLAASGNHLDQLLATLTAEFGEQLTTRLPKRLSTASLADDISGLNFIWGDRPYALAAVPGRQSTQPDWIFVTQLPQSTSEIFSAPLNQLARESGFNVGPLQLGDTSVTAWTVLSTASTATNGLQLQAEVKGLLAEVDDYGILASSAQALDQALKATQNSIAANPLFQTAIAPLPQTSAKTDIGTFYLDWPTLRPILESQLPTVQWASRWGQPWLDHLQSLAIRGRPSSRQSLRQGSLFIRLVER